jgi:hypothetical protein
MMCLTGKRGPRAHKQKLLDQCGKDQHCGKDYSWRAERRGKRERERETTCLLFALIHNYFNQELD